MSGTTRRSATKLTARGAIALALLSTLAGHVLSAVFGLPILVGAAFLLGSLAGVLLVNARELLSLVVTPPLVFFAATLVVQIGSALAARSFLQSLAVGLYTSLSAGAPWLFAGSALVLGVAWRRGLRENVRELREELKIGAPDIPKPRTSSFAPEPEGYFEPRLYGSPRVED